ncbi:unnamed protein product [Acanthoscelides obtectus]|uniref:Uncharacterized protein n=1 Tax=Acanthoscelides obtectus TaxID=200917 RepID=A0A9P0JJM7_ACAOB|nr:unnamed protein product [Acanthoscelides obtectus]CAK1628915.1 hypothetical protein AOBTE_LOCUS5464 [Acanthoscelides obtectus]
MSNYKKMIKVAFLEALSKCGAARIPGGSGRVYIESPRSRFLLPGHEASEDYLPEPQYQKAARRSDGLQTYQPHSEEAEAEAEQVQNYPSYEYERRVQGTSTVKQRQVTVKKPAFVEQYLKEVTPTTSSFAAKVDINTRARNKPPVNAATGYPEQADESIQRQSTYQYLLPRVQHRKQEVEPHFQFELEEPRAEQASVYVPPKYQNEQITHDGVDTSSPRSLIHVTQSVPKKHIRKVVKPKQSPADEDIDYYSRLQELQQLQQKHAKAHSHAYESDKGDVSPHFHPEENTKIVAADPPPAYVQHLAQYQQDQLKQHPAPVKYQAKLAFTRHPIESAPQESHDSGFYYHQQPDYQKTASREGKRAHIKYQPTSQRLPDGLEYTQPEQTYESFQKAPARQYHPSKPVAPPRYGYLPRAPTLIYPDQRKRENEGADEGDGDGEHENQYRGPMYLPNAKTAEEEKYQPAAFSKSKTIRFQKGNGQQLEYEQVNLPVEQQQALARYEMVAARLQQATKQANANIPKHHFAQQEPRYVHLKYLPAAIYQHEAKQSSKYREREGEPQYQQQDSADRGHQYRQPDTIDYQSHRHNNQRPTYAQYDNQYE